MNLVKTDMGKSRMKVSKLILNQLMSLDYNFEIYYYYNCYYYNYYCVVIAIDVSVTSIITVVIGKTNCHSALCGAQLLITCTSDV